MGGAADREQPAAYAGKNRYHEVAARRTIGNVVVEAAFVNFAAAEHEPCAETGYEDA